MIYELYEYYIPNVCRIPSINTYAVVTLLNQLIQHELNNYLQPGTILNVYVWENYFDLIFLTTCLYKL